MSYYSKKSTIYKMVKDVLDRNGYFSDCNTVSNAIDYIEEYNKNNDDTLTPEGWFYATKDANPEMLVHKNRYYEKLLNDLAEQRKLCIEQTGNIPCIYDYSENMRSEEWEKTHKMDLDLSDVFNYLLDYYLKEGNV